MISNFQLAWDQLKQKKSTVLTSQISSDLITPVLALLKIKAHYPDYHFLFESVEKGNNRGRYSIIGIMPDFIWKISNQTAHINNNPSKDINDFTKINQHPITSLRGIIAESKIQQDGLSDLSSGIFGYMSYDMVRLMEDLPDKSLPDDINIPDSVFIRPQITIVFDSLFDVININAPIYYKNDINIDNSCQNASDNIQNIINILESPEISLSNKSDNNQKIKEINFVSNFNQGTYCQAVERSQEYIKNGDIFQVLPSQRFTSPFPNEKSFEFYRSLRRINPSPFLFYIKFSDFSLVGSSPEIMVSTKENKVTIRPLAGTRKRGRTSLEDQEIAKDLLGDEKEVAEHLMLIDLGRHDVGKVCKAGSVELTEKMAIEHYSHVMHISSNVEGILDDAKYDALDALISGFPAGTVSGAPKIRAMEIIEELENTKRGFYAGCVGYFSGNGNMETCITLRSALIKNNQIHLQAGAGVVFDSDPKSEYQECLNKAEALMKAVRDCS